MGGKRWQFGLRLGGGGSNLSLESGMRPGASEGGCGDWFSKGERLPLIALGEEQDVIAPGDLALGVPQLAEMPNTTMVSPGSPNSRSTTHGVPTSCHCVL